MELDGSVFTPYNSVVASVNMNLSKSNFELVLLERVLTISPTAPFSPFSPFSPGGPYKEGKTVNNM